MQVVREIARLCWRSDAFFAQLCYRIRTWLRQHRIPMLPQLLHRISMWAAQVCIGDPVSVGPGLYVPHGQVVIDGITRVGPDCVVAPFVTIGLREGSWVGPTIGRGVHVGSGARVLGAITVGDHAVIGANAVVVRPVPAGATMAGIPARRVK